MNILNRIKTLWRISEAELTVNYAQEVKLKSPKPKEPEKKLAEIVDFHPPKLDIPHDNEL